ncbi:unnamed protein product [Linum trigynum]|uniref:Uncharacterized protein n=1 Tax=Linum trigynum TaxID=586398 RepID=A0AAV2GL86_9ROSI
MNTYLNILHPAVGEILHPQRWLSQSSSASHLALPAFHQPGGRQSPFGLSHRQDRHQGLSLWSYSSLWAGGYCPGPVLQHRPLWVHCHPATDTIFPGNPTAPVDTGARRGRDLDPGTSSTCSSCTRGRGSPEASDAATRRGPHRTTRRTTPSAAGASTSAAGPSAAAPTSYIAEQLAAISRQNEQILAGQKHSNARLDREREGHCRIISAQHYMMSYWDMDPAVVSYPWEASTGHEDFNPPPAGDGGNEN